MAELSPSLQQFVPSSVCLKCEGCCRFQAADSLWRPKWDKKEFIDDHNYVSTIADCGKHLCRFFNKQDSTCRTYRERPFDCELYPFLLSQGHTGIDVHVHLACPYIQDHEADAALHQYVQYLRLFFARPDIRDFLKRHRSLVQDYGPVVAETRFLFTLPELDGPVQAQALLSQKNIFDAFLARSERPLSSYHFSAIFGWQDFFKFTFEVVEDRLCVFAWQGTDGFLYLPPLGGGLQSSTVKKCFERMGGARNKIARIENIPTIPLPPFPAQEYNTYLKAQEYLYRRKDLELLAGQAYKSQRHDIHVFKRRCPNARVRAFVPSDREDCLGLYRQWAANRRARHTDPVYVSMLQDNATVHALLMAHAAELGLVGKVVEIDGKIAAYTFGYALNAETFCVALEVTDLRWTGLSAFIFNRFCADPAVSPYTFLNTMDDFAMPLVAKTKNSYHPIQHVPVYALRMPAPSSQGTAT